MRHQIACPLLAVVSGLIVGGICLGQGLTGMEYAQSIARERSAKLRALLAMDASSLGEALNRKSVEDRELALLALGEKDPGAAEDALPTLAKLINTEDIGEPFFVVGRQRKGKKIKSATVATYKALGNCGSKAAPLVVRLLKESMEVRAMDSVRAGCDALGTIGSDDPEVISILQSPKPAWAANARAALARIRAKQ